MRIVREVAFIQYAEQSVCIISRNCCRSIGKWVKRPLTRHLVLRALEVGECLFCGQSGNVYLCINMIRLPFAVSSRFKIAKSICCSPPTEIEVISLRYYLKVHTVLILCFSSNIVDLSIFVDVCSHFLSIYWFSVAFTVHTHPSAVYSRSFEPLMTESSYFQSL